MSISLVYHTEFLSGALGNAGIKSFFLASRRHKKKRDSQPVKSAENASSIINHVTKDERERPVRLLSSSDSMLLESLSSKSKSRSLFQIFRKKKRSAKILESVLSNKTVNVKNSKNTSSLFHPTTAGKRIIVPQDFSTSSTYCKTIPSSASSRVVDSSSRSNLRSCSPSKPLISSTTTSDFSDTTLKELNDAMFENTLRFLCKIKIICSEIETSLMQSFSQKFARWALQPWTTNKETALSTMTNKMREKLNHCNQNLSSMPLLDPIDCSSEPLSSIDTKGCYILPSAHYPLLLTFDCKRNGRDANDSKKENENDGVFSEESCYRTIVKIVKLKESRVVGSNTNACSRAFIIHGSVSGSVAESHRSTGINPDFNVHVWNKGDVMSFNSRSTRGPPSTLSLRITETSIESNRQENLTSTDATHRLLPYQQECGYCWIDLRQYWEQCALKRSSSGKPAICCKARVVSSNAFEDFDEHGEPLESPSFVDNVECLDLDLKISTEILKTSYIKRSLLYKHNDDVRQEMFAIEFINSCDRILRSCGLDLKMLTFRSIPISKRRGLIEWIQGSVPLSEICQPFAGSILGQKNDINKTKNETTVTDSEIAFPITKSPFKYLNDTGDDTATISSVAKAGMANYESLGRLSIDCDSPSSGNNFVLPNSNNPIQDFLRSFAFSSDEPYKIQKHVMDTYIKSCAGYSVCTYILGVGDRHLDNLLLHQSGHFFHCDYSFILGNDPKKYLPMRITQDMINGMGGWTSDNYCQFLSLAGAAFIILRRPENARHLLSLVRLMEGCDLPDLERTQSLEASIQGVRDRLQLNMSEEEAIEFIEKLIEDSCASKLWIAVDAFHSLAQRF